MYVMTLCRRSDVGKPKAVVAADFINRRVAGCNVTAYLLHCFSSFLSRLLSASWHVWSYLFNFSSTSVNICFSAYCYCSVIMLGGLMGFAIWKLLVWLPVGARHVKTLPSCLLRCAPLTKPYNLISVSSSEFWYRVEGTVTLDLASLFLCITDCVVQSPTGSKHKKGR